MPDYQSYPTWQPGTAFAERGARLARRLAAELAGRYRVEYHDVRTGRREMITG
jgi:hypothetical protein